MPLIRNMTVAGETGYSLSESKFPLLLEVGSDGSQSAIRSNNVDRSRPVNPRVVPKLWRPIAWILVYSLLVHIALVAATLALLRNYVVTHLADKSFCKLLLHLLKFTSDDLATLQRPHLKVSSMKPKQAMLSWRADTAFTLGRLLRKATMLGTY